MPFKSASASKRKAPRTARKRVARRAPRRPRARGRVAPGSPAQGRTIQGIMGQATDTWLTLSKKHTASKMSGITKQSAPYFWLRSEGGLMNNDTGYQGVYTLGQFNSIVDTAKIAVELPSVATPTGDAPARFCMRSMTAEITLTNTSTQPAWLDLYDIECIHDVPLEPVVPIGSPSNAWKSGAVLQSVQTYPPAGAGSGITAYNLLGSRPSDSQLFRDFYRVKQKRTVLLQPNGLHVHHVSLKMHRSFDTNQMQAYLGYISALAGYTVFTMAVLRGAPVKLTEVASPSTGNPIVRFVVSERYEYNYIYNNASTLIYDDVLSSGTPEQLLLQSPAVGGPLGA